MSETSQDSTSGFKIPVKYSIFITLISFFGWTLAFMDAQFFGLLVPKILVAFSLNLNEISLITLVSNALAVVSAMLLGHLMDKRGRLLPFQITMVFYSLGSFFTAISGGFLSILGARTVVTLGTGPEGSVASVMVTENNDKRWRGISTGLLLLAVPVGVTIATIITGLVVVTGGLNWRYVFFIGIFPAILILIFRLKAKESARFVEMDKIRRESKAKNFQSDITDVKKVRHEPIRQIFESDLRRKSITVIIFSTLASGVFFSILLYATEYLTVAKGISYGSSLIVVGTGSSISIIGYVVATFIGQKIGRKETTIIFGLLGGVALFFLAIANGLENILISYVLFQVFFAAIGSTFVALFAEMYPTRARGAGQSLNFASQSAGYALWPLILTATVGVVGWDSAFLYVEVVPLVISAISLLAIPRVVPTAELESIAV
jgi:MFS family permease